MFESELNAEPRLRERFLEARKRLSGEHTGAIHLVDGGGHSG